MFNQPDSEIDEFTGKLRPIALQQNSMSYSPLNRKLLYTKPEIDSTVDNLSKILLNDTSTGVLSFAGISIASPTTFTVAPVKGWIINNETDPTNPTKQYVDWGGAVGVTATFVTTATNTFILLTPSLTILQQTTFPTPLQRKQNIFLGQLGHANMTSIIQVFNEPDITLSPASQLRDMFIPFHLINDGVFASPNGANLSFNTSAGNLYGLGIGFVANIAKPNNIPLTLQNPVTFQYRTQNGGASSNTSLVDPLSYDLAGNITTISGGAAKSTNQRIYLTQTGAVRVQYGQTIYNTLASAIAAVQNEAFIEFTNFTTNAVLIGTLSIQKSATDLSNIAQASFTRASKVGSLSGGSNGVSTTTLQQAYDNSVTPEILTDNTRGAFSVKRGSSGDTDSVLEVLNGAGTITAKITGNGLMYPAQATTVLAPAYVKGAIYFDTTLNALRIGGATGWETITSV